MARQSADLSRQDDGWKLDLGRGELAPVYALLWVVSGVRVVAGILRHETFGTVGTLAMLAVVLLPFSLRKAGRNDTAAHRRSVAQRIHQELLAGRFRA